MNPSARNNKQNLPGHRCGPISRPCRPMREGTFYSLPIVRPRPIRRTWAMCRCDSIRSGRRRGKHCPRNGRVDGDLLT